MKQLRALALILLISGCENSSKTPSFQPPLLIAHASGGTDNGRYLNSLEALNHNYDQGLRYFEVDFSWTSDGHLVLIHDWKQTYKRLFNNDSGVPPTKNEFMAMEMAYKQTQMSLDQFAEWMNEHPEAILIADIKGQNIKGLKLILQTIKDPYHRVIPQLYKIANFEQIRDLGFAEQNIMYTMYKTMEINDEVIDFIQNTNLFAISLQPQKPYFDQILKQFGSAKTPIYTLTINDIERFKAFQKLGVDGTVTDFINPLMISSVEE